MSKRSYKMRRCLLNALVSLGLFWVLMFIYLAMLGWFESEFWYVKICTIVLGWVCNYTGLDWFGFGASLMEHCIFRNFKCNGSVSDFEKRESSGIWFSLLMFSRISLTYGFVAYVYFHLMAVANYVWFYGIWWQFGLFLVLI